MRIGFDGRFIRPYESGSGVFVRGLVRGLARLDDENHYFIYVLEGDSSIRKHNFEVKQMPPLHANAHLRLLVTFPAELRKARLDIFHAVYTVPIATFSRVILSLAEVSCFTNPGEYPVPKLHHAQACLMMRYAIRRADRIIVPTRYVRDGLLQYFNVPAEKVRIIPFGVNDYFFTRCSPEEIERVKAKYSLAGDYILYVGDLQPRKNLARVIEAFSMLREAKPIPHDLVLVGKPLWRAEQIYEKANASRARESIKFPGYVPLSDLRALYQGATLLCFPSLDEGFGLPVHEAMASGTPVLVSNRGGLPEAAGDAALYVDALDLRSIADGILNLIEHPALRGQLSAKGVQQARRFSWESSCRQTLQVYREVSATSPNRKEAI